MKNKVIVIFSDDIRVQKGINMKNKKVIISSVAILLIVFVLIAGFLYSNRINYIEWQFKKMYGESFGKERNSINGNSFAVMTKSGILVFGTCDFVGNIKTESYMNYYYADESVNYIKDEIGSCFDDCIVVADYIVDSSLAKYEFDKNQIQSYEEYISEVKSLNGFFQPHFRVYIRESENKEHVNEAKAVLESCEEYFNVDFYEVSNDLYDAHKEEGIYCYTPGEYMEKLKKSLGEENIDRFNELIEKEEGKL